ncbi:MAG: hypothetical protein ACYCPP_07405 [Nitrososphaerales archaeon]
MASKLAEKAPGWFTRILMPELVEIKGALKNINTRIDELDKRLTDKIDSTRNELKSDISLVDSKIDEMDKRLTSEIHEMDKRLTSRIDSVNEKLTAKIDDLGERLDIVQRVAVLEAKQRETESKAR